MTRLLLAACAITALTLVAPDARAQAPASLDSLWEAYIDLSTEFDTLLQEVDTSEATTTQGDRLRREAAEVALELSDVTLELIERDESLGDGDVEAAQDQRLTALQIRGALLIEVRECAQAVDVLERLLAEEPVSTRPLLAERAEERLVEARRCADEASAAADPPAETAHDVPPAAAPEPDPAMGTASGKRQTGWILAGTGGALLATAFVWDASQSGMRREFRDLRDDCRNGETCNATRLDELDDSFDRSRVPQAALYGVGAAAAITGVVLAVLPSTSDRVSVAPHLSPGGGGLRVTAAF